MRKDNEVKDKDEENEVENEEGYLVVGIESTVDERENEEYE